MIVKGKKIFGKDGHFSAGAFRIENGEITEVSDTLTAFEGEQVLDYGEDMIIPGLVDIHFHGCDGYDFCDGTKEAMDAITAYQERNGVTSISPATMTLSREELAGIFKAAGQYPNETGSVIRGITMEGPFVSMAKKGAQNGAYIHKPDVEFYREMQKLSNGMILQVAVAPEEDEGLAVTKELSKETIVSVAHTAADYDTAYAAFEAGATHVTHLYNGMSAFTHRNPAITGAAFDHPDVFVELICDGIHIHPSMVRAVFQMFGAERVCMISDSMMATGLENGEYALGGQPVHVEGRLATLADGTIAGSASNLLDCLRAAVKDMKVPLEQVLLSCTLTPAKSLKIDNVCGSIEEGKDAQFIVLDENLELKTVYNRTLFSMFPR